jgi:hypothetical protein
MALCFTVMGTLPAARRIRILPMNQYAQWSITFGIKGRALCIMASNVVHMWEFVYDLLAMGSSYHLH